MLYFTWYLNLIFANHFPNLPLSTSKCHDTYGGTGPFSEPESRAHRDYQENFKNLLITRKADLKIKIFSYIFFFEIFKSENFRINLRIWHIIIILSLLYIHIHRHIHMKLTTRTSSQIWPESWFQKFEKFTEKDILTAKDPILKTHKNSLD